MDKNAKKVIFEVENVAIYALFSDKFLKFGKCACVKNLTNIMSASKIISTWVKFHFVDVFQVQLKLCDSVFGNIESCFTH